MIATLLSWVAMPLVRYALIAVGGLLFTAFMRADAARPWKNQVTELQTAIVVRDQIIKSHNELAEEDRVKAEALDKEIEAISHAAKPDDCRLTTADLTKLRQLAR